MLENIVHFKDLPFSDFVPGNIYCAGQSVSFSGEPLSKLFKLNNSLKGLGNQGGIRASMVEVNKKSTNELSFLVLVNRGTETEWPNYYDKDTSILTFYGDNKKEGNKYLNTKQKGNQRFEELYSLTQGNNIDRLFTCPIFYFESTEPGSRNYRYIGLAYPLVHQDSTEDSLKLIQTKGVQNLKAKFIMITDEIICREWLYDLKAGNKDSSIFQPNSWDKFLANGSVCDLLDEVNTCNHVTEYGKSYSINKSSTVLNSTSREVEIRLTQNKFRETLLKKSDCCRICGLDYSQLLVASHILPWSLSDDIQKLDSNNGLLLCVMHDKLFDRFLLSFDDSGKIIISNQIKKRDYQKLQISLDLTLDFTKEEQAFLKIHRQRFKMINKEMSS